jgi:hypothetical protein
MARSKNYYSLEEEFGEEAEKLGRGFTFEEWLKIAADDKITHHLKVDSQFKIIEKFVQEAPKIKPVNKTEKQADDVDFEEYERGENNVRLEDIVSETLARVYFDQQLFSKAIRVYEKLGLLYPENSAYFAAQIKKIKKVEAELKK